MKSDTTCPLFVPKTAATFNIENYPKSPRQEEAAFAVIRETRASAVGVQEIASLTRTRRRTS